jgi:hypothetical protein
VKIIRTLLWLALFAHATGCKIPPMVIYYRSAASGSDAAKTCYKVLNTEGESRFIKTGNMIAAGDEAGGMLYWREWEETRVKGKKVCDGIDGFAAEMLAAAPLVEAAIDREKRISEWVVRATKAAADAVAELRDLGIIKGGR